MAQPNCHQATSKKKARCTSCGSFFEALDEGKEHEERPTVGGIEPAKRCEKSMKTNKSIEIWILDDFGKLVYNQIDCGLFHELL